MLNSKVVSACVRVHLPRRARILDQMWASSGGGGGEHGNVRAWLDVACFFVNYNERRLGATHCFCFFLLSRAHGRRGIWGDQGWVIMFGSYPSVCFAPRRRGCVSEQLSVFERGWKKARKKTQSNKRSAQDNINVGVIAQTDKIFFPFSFSGTTWRAKVRRLGRSRLRLSAPAISFLVPLFRCWRNKFSS